MFEALAFIMGAFPFIVGIYALRKIKDSNNNDSDDEPPPPEPEPEEPPPTPSPRSLIFARAFNMKIL